MPIFGPLDQNIKTMKTSRHLRHAAALIGGSLAIFACEGTFGSEREDGQIEIAFCEKALPTRAGISPSDTNSFILKVTDSKGKSVYEGKYGEAPSSLLVSAGKYTVQTYSQEFNAPAFSTPQYGDSQDVTVKSGQKASVTLMVHQTNAGVRLNTSSEFLTAYPSGSLHLKSDEGKLLYSYTEKRIAYFLPGRVSLILSNGATDETLLTRTLAAQEILTLNLSVAQHTAEASGRDIILQVDTSRNWITEDYAIGGSDNKGSSMGNAFSVSEAAGHAGEKGVWVYGYIVGGDLSSSKVSFTSPFSSKTNLAIAARAGCTDRSQCMSVQLDAGDVRDALNLPDNPGRIGKQIFLKGNIVSSYYGLPGIQGITEFELKP